MPFLRSLRDNCRGMVDLGVILMIGIAFVGLMVVTYIIYTIQGSLTVDSGSVAETTMNNITSGWSDAINLLLIAITILILAIAISALLLLRGR